MRVHECKVKVDGITKFVVSQDFDADRCFGNEVSTESVYQDTLQESLKGLIESTRENNSESHVLTCFAFGQTSSGKTFTMQGISKMAAD